MTPAAAGGRKAQVRYKLFGGKHVLRSFSSSTCVLTRRSQSYTTMAPRRPAGTTPSMSCTRRVLGRLPIRDLHYPRIRRRARGGCASTTSSCQMCGLGMSSVRRRRCRARGRGGARICCSIGGCGDTSRRGVIRRCDCCGLEAAAVLFFSFLLFIRHPNLKCIFIHLIICALLN